MVAFLFSLEGVKLLFTGAAFGLSIYALVKTIGFSKVNILYGIQKLALEKARDCNLLCEALWERHFVEHKASGSEGKPFNFHIVNMELAASLSIINETLENFRQNDKKLFIHRIFWIQIKREAKMDLLYNADLKAGKYDEYSIKAAREALDSLKSCMPYTVAEQITHPKMG